MVSEEGYLLYDSRLSQTSRCENPRMPLKLANVNALFSLLQLYINKASIFSGKIVLLTDIGAGDVPARVEVDPDELSL